MPEIVRENRDIDLVRSAVFDETEVYRYSLKRIWLPEKEAPRKIVFVMLNPSTADHLKEDPTIKRCMVFSFGRHYDEMEIVNLFALRATDPADMKAHVDPVGPKNDEYIRKACGSAETVVCAWGAHGDHLGRAASVRNLLPDVPLRCFGTNAGGSPKHPLYLKGGLPLLAYQGA